MHVREKLEAALVQAQGEIESQHVIFTKLEEKMREEMEGECMRNEENFIGLQRM